MSSEVVAKATDSSSMTDTSPQPLLAGAYVLLANLLTQNLRRASLHPPLYLQVDEEYNGLGTEYSGEWRDAHTLVITVLNATLPNEGECFTQSIDGVTQGSPGMSFASGAWFVTKLSIVGSTGSWRARSLPLLLPVWLQSLACASRGWIGTGCQDCCLASSRSCISCARCSGKILSR